MLLLEKLGQLVTKRPTVDTPLLQGCFEDSSIFGLCTKCEEVLIAKP